LHLFDATVDAVAERARAEVEAQRWTQQDELLAMNAELVHAVYRAVIGTSGNKPPKPLKIKRPGSADSDTQVMSHKQLLMHAKEE
jgi:hypothetical protein